MVGQVRRLRHVFGENDARKFNYKDVMVAETIYALRSFQVACLCIIKCIKSEMISDLVSLILP